MIRKALAISLALMLFAGLALANDATTIKGSVVVPVYINPPQSNATDDSTIWLDDFESGQGDWTTVDVTAAGVKWHIDDFNGYQSTNSWWCADTILMGYDNHWLQYLVTPALDFSDVINPMLTFKMYRAMEDPAGTTPPWDGWDGCNVWASTDNGATWDVITPTSPAYNCQSLYSFGEEWGMGEGIAGWGGTGPGWEDATFNLSSLVGNSQVKIRFAFCSDPAYCTIDDPLLWGFFVDEVSIDDGAVNLLTNDADGVATPSEFTFDTGLSAGDWWAYSTVSSHTPTHCMQFVMSPTTVNCSDACVSPWLDIPTGEITRFRFWLWCNLLDWDGNNDNILEDYYHVEVSTNGVVWNEVFYDYGDSNRPGGATVGWEQYVPGDPFNGNIEMDLSAYAGQQIKLRWRIITDGNNDGGVGSGFFLDDVELFTTGFSHDVGAENLHVPFPTSLGNRPYSCSVELTNFGSQNQSMVSAFWRIDSTFAQPLIPWVVIPAGQSVTKEFPWNPTAVGDYFMDAYTTLILDQDRSNDTTWAGQVTVTDSGYYELGYDARQHTWTAVYYFNFNLGYGAMCRFVPAEHTMPVTLDITTIKGLFFSTGGCELHIYDAGTATTPGPEIFSQTFTVTVIRPAWQTINVAAVTALQNRTTPFWVWFKPTVAQTAQIMGDDGHPWNTGKYFSYNGSAATQSAYEFYIRAAGVPTTGGTTPDVEVILEPINPPIQIPANGGTFQFNIGITNNEPTAQIIDIWTFVTLPNGSQYGPILNVPDLNRPAGSSATRERDQAVPAGAPTGDYSYDAYVGVYPNTIWDEASFGFTKLATDNGGPFVYDWNSSGESLEGLNCEVTVNVVDNFSLVKAYPNPFNPVTTIGYMLPKDAEVELTIYNVLGEKVATLVNAVMPSGGYNAVWDASGVTSGMYFYQIKAAALDGSQTFTDMGKMLLLK